MLNVHGLMNIVSLRETSALSNYTGHGMGSRNLSRWSGTTVVVVAIGRGVQPILCAKAMQKTRTVLAVEKQV